MNLFTKQKQKHRCREQTYRYKGGEKAMNWDTGIEIDIYILQIYNIYIYTTCLKQVTNKNLKEKKRKEYTNKQDIRKKNYMTCKPMSKQFYI